MKTFKEFVKEANIPPIPTTSPMDGGMISTPNPEGDEEPMSDEDLLAFGKLWWPRIRVILRKLTKPTAIA